MDRAVDRGWSDEVPVVCEEVGGVRIFVCGPDGPRLASERDASDLLGAGWGYSAQMIVVPVERLGEQFFPLSTRIAGWILQKFATYGMRIAIVGDLSGELQTSDALRDFVYETNRHDQAWFLPGFDDLVQRLETPTQAGER